MKITEFFDPYNMDHIKVYGEEVAHGFYPTGFFPKDIEYVSGWKKIIMSKMANAWTEQVLAGNVAGMPPIEYKDTKKNKS